MAWARSRRGPWAASFWNSFRHVGPLPHGEFDPHPISPDGGVGDFPEHGVLSGAVADEGGSQEICAGANR